MKNLGYRLRFIFSDPKKTTVEIIRNWAALVGGIYTLATIADSVQSTWIFLDIFSEWFVWICIVAAILSLVISVNWIPHFTCKVDDYDVKISLEVGDASKRKKSLVFSTNSSFATTMDNGVISPTSVQGAFQNKYYKGNLGTFDSKIKKALQLEFPTDRQLNMFGKMYSVYPVGTTAIFRQNNRWVHMVALNDLNEYGQNASRDIEDMYTALNGLWTTICEKGHIESELSIPLIASGRAGIADATKETVIQAIVDSFLVSIQNSRCKITGHLRIVIFPSDLERINVQKMKDYLRYRCYFTKRPSNDRNGTAVS